MFSYYSHFFLAKSGAKPKKILTRACAASHPPRGFSVRPSGLGNMKNNK